MDLDIPTLTTDQLKAQHLNAGDYETYLTLFDSHERLGPLVEIAPLLSDAQFWQLVRFAWMTSETTHRARETWYALLTAKRSDREHLMDDEERVALAHLPKKVRIYRGCGDDAGIYGMSWTLDRHRAKRFAFLAHGLRRFLRGEVPADLKPTVAAGWCKNEDILAHFTARDEAEIVINPKHVTVTRAVQWSWPLKRR